MYFKSQFWHLVLVLAWGSVKLSLCPTNNEKAEQVEKSATLSGFVRKMRSQGKPLLLKTNEYRESWHIPQQKPLWEAVSG